MRTPNEHRLVQGAGRSRDKNGAGWGGIDGGTLFDAAAQGGDVEIVSRLLEGGAQPDTNVVSAADGRSALYRATASGHENAAMQLVVAGISVEFLDPVDGCAIFYSTRRLKADCQN